jgi:hypothetical protein
MVTEEQSLGQMPEALRRETFCQSRRPPGACPYSRTDWNGQIVKVESVYQPSGRYSLKHVALLLVAPALLTLSVAFVAHLLVPYLGWLVFVLDVILGFLGLGLLHNLLRYCRNQIVSTLTALAGVALTFWAWRKASGILETAGTVSVPGLDGPADAYLFHSAIFGLAGAFYVGMGLFSAASNAFCEKCERPMRWENDRIQSVSPLAILYWLRKGRIAPDLAKKMVTFPLPHHGVSNVEIARHWCESCGDGMVEGVIHYHKSSPKHQRDPLRFYSEPWTRAEIEQSHRNDAITGSRAGSTDLFE